MCVCVCVCVCVNVCECLKDGEGTLGGKYLLLIQVPFLGSFLVGVRGKTYILTFLETWKNASLTPLKSNIIEIMEIEYFLKLLFCFA